jgi:hypothetical protein
LLPGGVTQVVEGLPSKSKAPVLPKKTQKKQKQKNLCKHFCGVWVRRGEEYMWLSLETELLNPNPLPPVTQPQRRLFVQATGLPQICPSKASPWKASTLPQDLCPIWICITYNYRGSTSQIGNLVTKYDNYFCIGFVTFSKLA